MVAGTLRSHREVIEGMTTTMSSMAYYIVMVFFAAQFTRAFGESNLGALLALEGTRTLQALGMPAAVMILGVVGLAATLDVVVPSASAKWALLAPIVVPMLMGVGIAPELTQAAFRIGDGPVNLVTPLMPYISAGAGILPPLCEELRPGLADGARLPARRDVPDRADGALAALVGTRRAARDRRPVHVSVTSETPVREVRWLWRALFLAAVFSICGAALSIRAARWPR